MLLLVLLAAPYWPGTVDDVYITVGFARQWAETGALTWTDGVRVEGYSNFQLVALLALGIGLGADGAVLAQCIALGCGVAIVSVASWKMPRTRLGTIAVMGLAVWNPLCRWSVIGMETTLYALLLSLGWMAAISGQRWFGHAVWLLVIASLTRPEGAACILFVLFTQALGPIGTTKRDFVAIIGMSSLLVYHTGRV